MKKLVFGISALLFSALANVAFAAGSLQVSPIGLDLQQQSSVLHLSNPGDEVVKAQVRIFKWQQINGKEMLVATRDVVASPPQMALAPGAKNVVRVVRLSKQPIVGEETYRILVDQLPKPVNKKGANISFLMRYSIPVFFNSPDAQVGQISWNGQIKNGNLIITASNNGDRRVKLSALKITGPSGQVNKSSQGLAGYVLGGATNTLLVTKLPKGIKAGSQLEIAVNTDQGPLKSVVRLAGK